MKLIKGIVTIMILSLMIFSCKEAKKEVENPSEKEIVVEKKTTVEKSDKIAAIHSCEKKCSDDCTEENCAKCIVATVAHKAECTINKVKATGKKVIEDANKVIDETTESVKSVEKTIKEIKIK